MNHALAPIAFLIGFCLLVAACSRGNDMATSSAPTDPLPAATATAAGQPAATTAAVPTSAPTTAPPAQPASTATPAATATATIPPTLPPASPTSSPQAAPTATLAPVDVELVTALQAGGHVLYLHVATFGSSGGLLETCLAERPLADTELAAARSLSVALQQLEIPIGRVVSGETCGELVTAWTAFGHLEPETTGALGEVSLESVEPGSNLVVVSAVPVLEQLAAGDAVIMTQAGETWQPLAIVRSEEWLPLATAVNGPAYQQYPVPSGSRPHDIAPALDGGIWYTAQGSGHLGWLDPVTGATRHIALGPGSSPHGVIVGPDGAPWITDSGQNAIVRVDPHTDEVQVFPLPPGTPNTNLNTAAFDGEGLHWFTGQNGYYGSVDPATGEVRVWPAPGGRGPYGIDATPDGDIYYSSLAGSHIAQIDTVSGEATVIEPPTAGQGARRVWSDSQGRIWVSEWNSGQVSVYDPSTAEWRAWRLPGGNPMTYAVYVDERDIVWLSDFGANALVRFDPQSETFESFPLPANPSNVRQILGRPHEVWGAESAADTLVVLRVP